MEITIRYSSIDRYRVSRKFKTLVGAKAFAVKWVGEHPEIGSNYAVSGDGVGKITVSGDAGLSDLFPQPESRGYSYGRPLSYEEWQGDFMGDRHDADIERDFPPPEALTAPRAPGCVCSEEQLIYVGCDCHAENGGPPQVRRAEPVDDDDWCPF